MQVPCIKEKVHASLRFLFTLNLWLARSKNFKHEKPLNTKCKVNYPQRHRLAQLVHHLLYITICLNPPPAISKPKSLSWSTPLLCLEGVPDLPVAPQDEAGLTKTFQTWPRGWFHIP